MSTIYADNIKPNLQDGVHIPGHVIQTLDTISTTTNGTSITTSTPVTVASIDITPRAAGSKFVITATFAFNIEPTDNYQNVGLLIYSGSSQIQKYFSHYFGQGTGSSEINDVYFPITHTAVYEPSYSLGDTITFDMRIQSDKGSSSVGYPTVKVRNTDSQGKNRLLVQEIAQ